MFLFFFKLIVYKISSFLFRLFFFCDLVRSRISYEARSLERTCSKLIGFLDQREASRKQIFQSSLSKAWTAVEKTKQNAFRNYETEKKNLEIRHLEIQKNAERNFDERLLYEQNKYSEMEKRMTILLKNCEARAKDNYEKGRDENENEQLRRKQDFIEKEQILKEQIILYQNEKNRMIEKIQRLENISKPEILNQIRNEYSILETKYHQQQKNNQELLQKQETMEDNILTTQHQIRGKTFFEHDCFFFFSFSFFLF